MKTLSQAIFEGSQKLDPCADKLLSEDGAAACPLGMALAAVGRKPADPSDLAEVLEEWPWTKRHVAYPCNCHKNASAKLAQIIAHVWDKHVMRIGGNSPSMSRDQFIRWVQGIEEVNPVRRAIPPVADHVAAVATA